MARFSLFHWIYTQNGLNLFFALTVAKKDADEKRKILILLFSPAFILKIQKKKIHPTLFFGCKKGCKSRNYLIYTLCCGERGIRTPGTFQCGSFQDCCNRPLYHLSFSRHDGNNRGSDVFGCKDSGLYWIKGTFHAEKCSFC